VMHGTHRGNASVLTSGVAGCTGKKRRKGGGHVHVAKKKVAWAFTPWTVILNTVTSGHHAMVNNLSVDLRTLFVGLFAFAPASA